MDDNRKYVRYADFGRVECEELCPFPGTLNDISQNGMKVTFNSLLSLDMADEYKMIVRVPRMSAGYMELIATPAWVFERNGTFQVGFSIILSAGNYRFGEYIHHLQEEYEVAEDEEIFV